MNVIAVIIIMAMSFNIWAEQMSQDASTILGKEDSKFSRVITWFKLKRKFSPGIEFISQFQNFGYFSYKNTGCV